MLREIRRDVPALGGMVRAARYRVLGGDGIDVGGALEAFRARGSVTVRRERNGRLKSWDLGEQILSLERTGADRLRLTLALGGGEASIRPDDVLTEIFGERAGDLDVIREDLLLDWGGRFLNPLLAATVAASDGKRAPG